jgi:acetyltransferase-like isoleucine patch superfamily enzyme
VSDEKLLPAGSTRVSVHRAVKWLARSLATIVAAPALVSYWIRRPLLGADRALTGTSQTLSLVPGLLGQYVRRAFLSRVLLHCHHTATIEFGTLFSKVGAHIDANVYVGPRCHLGLVHIEPDALLGPAVHIPSGPMTHGSQDTGVPMREQAGTPRVVRIGAGAWVGSGAIILADVGRGTVIGAGAVVTTPIPDLVVAAGVPARVIKSRG